MARVPLWIVLMVVMGMLLIVITGSGIISTRSGCQSHLDEDPTWQAANWYGLGVGFCLEE
jgi:hypothetical protein